jgi:hypothetical protein
MFFFLVDKKFGQRLGTKMRLYSLREKSKIALANAITEEIDPNSTYRAIESYTTVSKWKLAFLNGMSSKAVSKLSEFLDSKLTLVLTTSPPLEEGEARDYNWDLTLSTLGGASVEVKILPSKDAKESWGDYFQKRAVKEKLQHRPGICQTRNTRGKLGS